MRVYLNIVLVRNMILKKIHKIYPDESIQKVNVMYF